MSAPDIAPPTYGLRGRWEHPVGPNLHFVDSAANDLYNLAAMSEVVTV